MRNILPVRLKEMRIMYGYTVEELAGKVGVAKQAISKYETGKMMPSAGVLDKIAKVFSLPKGYLTKEDVLQAENLTLFYRKTKRMPQREMEEALVRVKWLYEVIAGCNHFYFIKKPDLPVFPTGAGAEKSAEILRQYWGMKDKAIEDMVTLLEEHGFYLFSADLDSKQIDGYSCMAEGYPIIILNQNKGTKERQQFSLAHELGHLILHCGQMGYIAPENMEELEKEADQFAGCFLMPENEVKKELLRPNAEYISRLSKMWHVSPSAMVKRCQQLSLLGNDSEENQIRAASLFKKFNKFSRADTQTIEVLCTIREILQKIDGEEEKKEEFLKLVRLPIRQIQKICSLSGILCENGAVIENEKIEDIEGIQLSLPF